MRKTLLLLLLATAGVAIADTVLKNEGSTVGPVKTLNCVGGGLDCTRTGTTGTVTVSGIGLAPDGGTIVSNVTGAEGLGSSGGATPAIGCLDAGTTVKGCVTTGAQSFAGTKTFTGAVAVGPVGISTDGGLIITGGTTSITPALPVASGGSAKALTLVTGGVLWTDADSFEVSAAGTSGQHLRSNGTSAPSWESALGVRTQADDLDIPACVNTTVTITKAVTGCSLGTHCEITPLQDDAAWDIALPLCFCEDSTNAKVVYNCGSGTANPAATNDYLFDTTAP